jgi:CRISPR-associated endoribonuclease Cas6
MPALIELHLEVTHGLPQILPYYLHGLIHKLLGGQDTELGRALHGGGVKKPLALSWAATDEATAATWLLDRSPVRPWQRLKTKKKGPHLVCQLRLLDEGLAPRVLEQLARFLGQEFGESHPGGLAVLVRAVAAKPCPTYAELWAKADEAPAPAEVELSFISPTTVSASGQGWPLPIPRYVWNGLERRWNAFSPYPFDLRSWWETHLVCKNYKAQQALHPASRRESKEPGFTGWARFAFIEEAAAHQRRQTAALATFAEYAGVGENRAFGWGVVRAKVR